MYYAIDYYKNRIKEAKVYYPYLFRNDTESSNLFNKDVDVDLNENNGYHSTNINKRLSFEEIMLIDIEKGIRKDLKLKLRRETSEKK